LSLDVEDGDEVALWEFTAHWFIEELKVCDHASICIIFAINMPIRDEAQNEMWWCLVEQ
jgi:hypothetical protein